MCLFFSLSSLKILNIKHSYSASASIFKITERHFRKEKFSVYLVYMPSTWYFDYVGYYFH